MPPGPDSIPLRQGAVPSISAFRAGAGTTGAISRSAEEVREAAAGRYLIISAAAFVVIFGIVWIYSALLPMAFQPRD